jgi:uncharacterized protein (DUF2252 family)
MIVGYEGGLSPRSIESATRPDTVGLALRNAIRRTWKHLAEERIRDSKPSIPLGNSFWPLEKTERVAIRQLFMQEDVRRLATMLRSRKDNAGVEVLDAAYWVKGCSSLGRLRFAVVLGVGKKSKRSLCLMDVMPQHQDIGVLSCQNATQSGWSKERDTWPRTWGSACLPRGYWVVRYFSANSFRKT